jgi:antitoxin MazE
LKGLEIIMVTSLIRTGDSCGLRIPAAFMEEIGIEDAVEVLVEKGRLIVQPVPAIRRRWEAALASLAECVEDDFALGEIPDLPKRCLD